MSKCKATIITKFICISLSVVVGVLIGCFACSKKIDPQVNGSKIQIKSEAKANKKATKDDLGVVVAKINGKPVYQSEVQKKLSTMIPGQKIEFSSLDNAVKEVILKEVAADRVIIEKAYKQNFQNNEDVLLSVEKLKKTIVKEEFLNHIAKTKVTDQEIEQRYQEEVKSLQGKFQYKVSHILVETKSEADEVKELIKTKRFVDVAKEKSIDRQTAENGGDVGYMIDGVMVPEFENAVKKLKDGKISQPVKTRFGWHVIKLFKTIPIEIPQFDLVKDNISKILYQEEINSYTEKLSNNAKIELLDNAEENKAKENKVEENKVEENKVEENKAPKTE